MALTVLYVPYSRKRSTAVGSAEEDISRVVVEGVLESRRRPDHVPAVLLKSIYGLFTTKNAVSPPKVAGPQYK